MLPTQERIKKRHPLKRALRGARKRVPVYQQLILVTCIVAILLAVAAFTIATQDPDPIALGGGAAGVIDVHDPSEPLPTDAIQAETESVPLHLMPGRPAGAGPASFYGNEFAGRRTASGETFHPERLTAAHRTLPLGSTVRVTNVRNGRSVVVRINDRGPFHGNRVIDLSKGAARELGFIHTGTAPVEIELLPSRG